MCGHDCMFANDGACDDGGLEAAHSFCPLGSDCADCDVRTIPADSVEPHMQDYFTLPPPPPPLPRELVCLNTCLYSFNSVCDDPGLGWQVPPDDDGSVSMIVGFGRRLQSRAKCDSGTDCHDCGPRVAPMPSPPPSPSTPPPPPSPPSPSPPICTGTCRGLYSNRQLSPWTRDERCELACPSNKQGWWNWANYYFQSGGLVHNCVCPDTKLPGDVTTSCSASDPSQQLSGFELCCTTGQCFRSTAYVSHSPPPLPPAPSPPPPGPRPPPRPSPPPDYGVDEYGEERTEPPRGQIVEATAHQRRACADAHCEWQEGGSYSVTEFGTMHFMVNQVDCSAYLSEHTDDMFRRMNCGCEKDDDGDKWRGSHYLIGFQEPFYCYPTVIKSEAARVALGALGWVLL